jgi:methylamine dehydrogenase accessory protein MauD
VLWRFKANAFPPIHKTILAAVADLDGITAALLAIAVICGVAALIFWQRPKPEQANPPLEALPLNTPAPHFEIESYDGGNRSLGQLLEPGKPLLLLFTSPKCGPCVNLFEEIKDWQDSHGEKLTIALVSRGSIKENFVSVAKNGLGEVLLQKKAEVAQLFRAGVTPTGILVSQEGRIASQPASGADEIRTLLESVLGQPLKNAETVEANAD